MDKKSKFVIKPFRPPNQLDKSAANEKWQLLKSAIDQIHSHNASSLSFEELYRNAYNLVLQKHGELLYQGVCDCIRAHLEDVAQDIAKTENELLLAKISKAWDEHKNTMAMVRDILMYMDRTYCEQQKKMKIYDYALILFRDIIARHSAVKHRLRDILLQSVANERNGQIVEQWLIKSTLCMLSDLGINSLAIYEQDFEVFFLDATREFYQRESLEYLTQNSCVDYITKAEARLLDEHHRALSYLNPNTEKKLKRIVEIELITNHAKSLVDDASGCVLMLEQDLMTQLARLYALLSRVPSTLEILRTCVCDHAKKTGLELVAEQEKVKEPMEFVKKLLASRDKYDRVVSEGFRNEKKMQKKLKDAFEDFINLDSRCASYLVLYLDELLRTGLKGVSEADADILLDKVIVLFRYLQDKDVFENFYKQYLSRRLLGSKSHSEEAERAMISKLKTECGYHFTSKLEGMFTDMTMSKETMESFAMREDKEVDCEGSHQRIELEVKVLTAAHWPASTVEQCKLPVEISRSFKTFEDFYLKKHTGRKLSWKTSLGSADVRGFFKTTHDLNVSTYQMCILMKFNESETVSLETLGELNIPAAELRRHLISLCTPKHRILKKSSKGKTIADDDVFTFNGEYSSKLKRVKIPLVSAKETSVVSEDIPQPVEEERRLLIEAAIVRIMKARKTLQHNELIAEVTRQMNSRFCAVPAFIKKRIESLIERDYLQRGNDDRRMYTYMA